jgi:adenylate cyclase
VSEAVKQRVEQHVAFRSVDRIKPKGFAAEAQVYELVGARAERGVRRAV